MAVYESPPSHYVIPGSHLLDPPGATPWSGGTSADMTGEWQVNMQTTAADPGNGHVRFNTANQSDATAIYLSKKTVTGLDVSNALAQNPTKAFIQREIDASRVARWNITSIVNNGTWFNLTVSPLGGSGFPLSGNDAVIILFRW